MKKNALIRFGASATVMALITSSTASKAAIIVDSTTGSYSGHGTVSGADLAQVFTTSVSGGISEVGFNLTTVGSPASAPTVTVQLDSVSGFGTGSPTFTDVATLGTLTLTKTAGSQFYSLTGNALTSAQISKNGTYAIELLLNDISHSSWNDVVNDNPPGTHAGISFANGTIPLSGSYKKSSGTWSVTASYNENTLLVAVPEVPMTGAAMGLGGLAMAGFSLLRRKAASAKVA